MGSIVNQPALVDLARPDRRFLGGFVRTGGTLRTSDNVTVGSVTVAPDGTLHAFTNSAGAVTADANADDMVVENNANVGLSLLCPDGSIGRVVFGDVSDSGVGQIQFDHGDDTFKFFISGGTSNLLLNDSGNTQPIQPAFLAFNSSEDANATGNGGVATVDFDTEVFDQGSNFASDTFTAPIAGRYLLQTQVRLDNLTSAADNYTLILVTSNRNYTLFVTDTDNLPSILIVSMSAVADMDTNDTVTVTVEVNGESSDVVDIRGAGAPETYFSGCLLA